jgi:hypothetical protein
LYANVSIQFALAGNVIARRVDRQPMPPISATARCRPAPGIGGNMEKNMPFMNDLKKYAISRLKTRRHRQTVTFLNSLPADLKKDIGWNGDLDPRIE